MPRCGVATIRDRPFGLALLHAGSGDQEQARALLEESFGLGGEAARREAENYEILGDLLR